MVRLLLFLSLPLYIIDQLTKGWVVKNIPLNGEGHVIVPNFFTIHHVANTGIAFGQFNGGKYSNYIFGGIAVIALSIITLLYRKGVFSGGFSRVAIALLVAGVCGNFTDRLLHGYVVDFLQFFLHIPGANPWPSFNVADSCVVCAAILLALASFFEAPKTAKSR
jgi:signal peptidase II